jgi:Flp pilus assembly protein TadD
VLAAQLREQYAAMNRAIARPDVSPVELADGYGAMGKLLMAADYLNSAEACLLDAQTLAPNDARWPYYLGHLYRRQGETGRSAIGRGPAGSRTSRARRP